MAINHKEHNQSKGMSKRLARAEKVLRNQPPWPCSRAHAQGGGRSIPAAGTRVRCVGTNAH